MAVPLVGSAPVPGLQALAGARDMLFGAAVRADLLERDPAYRAAVARECGVLTPELEMKWAWLEPRPGEWHWWDVDQIAAFARGAGKQLHGHALLWHQSIPEWARSSLLERRDWDPVQRFIAATMARYPALTWDVVNEPMEMGYRMDGLRPSPFLHALGSSYIARAFHAARAAAPDARLFLNEYDIDYDLPAQRDRRYLLLKLLERLKVAGVPIDGLGIQAHLDLVHQEAFDRRTLGAFLDAVGALGLEIRISELDVRDSAGIHLPPLVRQRRAADAVTAYLEVALDNRAVGTVSCWGISDRHSWLGDTQSLPLDGDYAPTAVHVAIASALQQRAVNAA